MSRYDWSIIFKISLNWFMKKFIIKLFWSCNKSTFKCFKLTLKNQKTILITLRIFILHKKISIQLLRILSKNWITFKFKKEYLFLYLQIKRTLIIFQYCQNLTNLTHLNHPIKKNYSLWTKQKMIKNKDSIRVWEFFQKRLKENY